MATRSKSAKYFLERVGIIPTHRQPVPIFDASRSLVHTEDLPAPLPIASLLVDGSSGPSRASVDDPWPHGPPATETSE